MKNESKIYVLQHISENNPGIIRVVPGFFLSLQR